MSSPPKPAPTSPSLPWRISSSLLMGMTGLVSKVYLYGLSGVEVTGLAKFLSVLEARRDPEKRQRGLITVCNHISVVDDPLVWGVLPISHVFDPSNLRWTLGAHDICFKNKFLADFFTCGQVLPAHRQKHSEFGGLFQPSITQAIRLLSSQPYSSHAPSSGPDIADPFSAGSLTFTTNGADVVSAPSYYQRNRHSWVHVFPEGLVHQHPARDLRYFKWGVARLILESEPAPDVLPMFIDGTHEIMPEHRTFPRFLPRISGTIHVAFGDVLDYEATFGDLRRRWQSLVQQQQQQSNNDNKTNQTPPTMLGVLPDSLKHSQEAAEIRIEVARRMRDEVLKVRRSLGYPEPDERLGSAETWAVDEQIKEKKYKSRANGSDINQD
ncbi:hypothetical protein B0T22DRAFT_31592 [Podospora appendiculata]|uniref:Tafazzin family protein n=1 Tax=Podospora appendiculata TaxID=314037 RepID=A0AAE0XGG9_9PEZI|nr:hypothetical protein B0T22DRAFT_31592 [Podospora appendiculata]